MPHLVMHCLPTLMRMHNRYRVLSSSMHARFRIYQPDAINQEIDVR